VNQTSICDVRISRWFTHLVPVRHAGARRAKIDCVTSSPNPGMQCLMPKAVFEQWRTAWGDENAVEFTWLLPPRCIAGRWGSVVQAEEIIANALANDKLLTVLKRVFDKKRKGDDDADHVHDGDDGVDEIRVEAMRSYSGRMGRWRRETLATASDALFRPLVLAMLVPHRILHHILCFLQKSFDEDTVNKIGGHVGQLVVFKAAEFSKEFSSKLEDCSWLEDVVRSVDDFAYKNTITRVGLLMVLHHAAAYDRRVRQVFDRLACSV
jgi:hypothetical protein